LLVSVGDVDIYGFEFDTQVAITDNLTFDGSVGVTKGKVLDPVAAGGPNLFPDQASPTWNVGATWSQPTANSGNFTANLSYAFLGEQETHNTIGTDSAYTLPSYGLLNGRVQWVSPSGQNIISVFGNNLLDKTYATYATRFGGGFWDAGGGAANLAPIFSPPRSMLSVVRGRPLEFGVTLQHNF
jgi:iron complex outermembrane receptor protein